MNCQTIVSALERHHPVMRYLAAPLDRVNTCGVPENMIPLITPSLAFILGERSGFWHQWMVANSSHEREKRLCGDTDTWIEGEYHVHDNSRCIYLRSGGSYGLLLYLLARTPTLFSRFRHVGVALGSLEPGVRLGGTTYIPYPTIEDLLVISLGTQGMFPDIEVRRQILGSPAAAS